MKTTKCCFCEKPIQPRIMSVNGQMRHIFDDTVCVEGAYVKKLKPRLACLPCDKEYRYWSNHVFQPLVATSPAIDTNALTKDGRDKLRTNLESCACTHKAKHHVDDGQGNLLHCQDCDCDHFWYAVPQARNTDLVVLSACEISGEATVVDKLRTMAEDERTNTNERIAAAKRMVAILEKQAA